MTKKIIWLLLFAAIITLIWFLSRPQLITVETVLVKPGLVEATVSNTRAGTISACKRSRLALSIGGQIASINVTEGNQVKQGDILLALWNKDVKAQLKATKAGFGAADYEKRSRCIQAASDKKEASRQKDLFSKKLVSEEAKDMATSKASASQAACTAAEARWQQAKALVSLAEASLEKTVLIAPFDGTVAEVTGEVGEFTTPSPPGVPTPPAIDLLTADCHYVKAPIDEVDAGKVAIDMPVRLTLDAFRGKVFNGRVKRISPYVQDFSKQARTVEVEVAFVSQELPQLLAGYSVDVEIILAKSTNVLRVPTDSIIDQTYVYQLNDTGMIEKIEISTGLSNWDFTEIVSGLKENYRVLVSPGAKGVEPGINAKSKPKEAQ